VLGSKYNVKADTVSNNAQGEVMEGKVSMKKEGAGESASATLTKDNFGLLDLSDGSITIEQVPALNYKSWATHRLVYSGQTLAQVSRQLERLYDIRISFADSRLKQLTLSADIEREGIEVVASTIARTFDIEYAIDNQQLIWKT